MYFLLNMGIFRCHVSFQGSRSFCPSWKAMKVLSLPSPLILLMVQKSGDHQLRLVGSWNPIIFRKKNTFQVNKISPINILERLKLRIYKETSWWIGGKNQGSLEVPLHHQELRSFNQKFRMTIRFSWNRNRPAKSGPTSTANRTRISLQHCTSGNGVWGWFTTQFLTQPS